MKLKTIYKTLIWLGIVIFIAGVVGDANAVSVLYNGSIAGTILFTTGVLVWVSLRAKNPLPHPYTEKRYKTSFDAIAAFLINNFLLEFWAFCLFFTMLLITLSGLGIKQSKAFKASVPLIQNSQLIQDEIGNITSFGNLVAGSVSSSAIDIDISIYGENGSGTYSFAADKKDDEWKLRVIEND